MSDTLALPALYSTDAEQAVLGSVLIHPDAYFEVSPFLRADDFYLIKHRWAWDTFEELLRDQTPIDVLTVSHSLERRGQLDEFGGTAYLAQLINTVPSSLHAEAYGRIVARDALRRRLLDSASHIARLAYDEGRGSDEVLGDAEAALAQVRGSARHREGMSLAEAAERYEVVAHERTASGTLPGLATGLTPLDEVLGGWQRSDFVIVAGRPGTGKSSLLLGAARHAAQHAGRRVAFFSLEMAGLQLVERLLAQATGLDARRLRFGLLRESEKPRLAEGVASLKRWPVRLFGPGEAVTPAQIRAHCLRLAQIEGLDLVIVDYLQLLRGDGRYANREQEVASISRSLKLLAGELNVPVVAGAHLSRAVEQRADKRPLLSDVRESGSQEQDADVVIFIHPLDEHGATQLLVAKHRNGPTHPGLDVTFRAPQTLFVGPSHSEKTNAS